MQEVTVNDVLHHALYHMQITVALKVFYGIYTLYFLVINCKKIEPSLTVAGCRLWRVL